MAHVFVSGAFDDLRAMHVRFLQETAHRGPVHVLLWPDELLEAAAGGPPRFPLPERLYFLESLRFVDRVTVLPAGTPRETLPEGVAEPGDTWAMSPCIDPSAPYSLVARRAWCAEHGIQPVVIEPRELAGFPAARGEPVQPAQAQPASRRFSLVVATGSFDWLHTGHVRFFEQAAALGELAVVVGHDANIRLLKGEGHPRFGQEERLFMVSAIRTVAYALLSTGFGWLDAAPELETLKPDLYVVNEDGDKPEKAAYCREHGIRYVVLHRAPRPGLPRRSSTELRGF